MQKDAPSEIECMTRAVLDARLGSVALIIIPRYPADSDVEDDKDNEVTPRANSIRQVWATGRG